MSLSNSLSSYTDCTDLLDGALKSRKGIRIGFTDLASARYYRMRMHHARALVRRQNREVYAEDHPQYGKSPYDVLTLRLRREEDKAWIEVVKQSIPAIVEELDEALTIEKSKFDRRI